MVKFLIQKPVAVLMATLALLLLGIVASKLISTSLMPEIAIPEITIQVSYANSSTREIESNIVRPLRNQLLQVSNLQDIETETRDGFATLKLIFEYGTDTNFAFIEVNEKVDASLNYLPRDLERPKVIKASVTDIPIFNLAISLKNEYSDDDFLELSEFTETIIKKRIEQLPDIALADLNGQISSEIIITPNSNKLRNLNITSEQLIVAIRQNNFDFGNMIVQNGIYQYNFKFSNPIRTKKDIENIYININKKLFQIKNVASVSILPKEERGNVTVNGKRAIVLAIIKQADARVYELEEALETLTTALKKDYPNLEFTITQDQTKLLKLSIDNLKSSLWIGSLLAVIIMFFFLKDIISPLIIAISIPISLILSLLLMYVFGLSINIISLSGLILGMGMMIDNAIIVIDNITQKSETGLDLTRACIEGTNEIITPLISSVLTTCSVFIPLLFLSGITGALFHDQALAIAIGLFASLIVSIILIPVIYKHLKKRKFKFEKWIKSRTKKHQIEVWYEKGYHYFFSKKWIIYGLGITGIVTALFFFKVMEYSQLPNISKSETILNIDWNENINVKENQNRIQKFLTDISEIEMYVSEAGEQQYLLQRDNSKSLSEASIYLKAKTVDQINLVKVKLGKNIKELYPSSRFQFEEPKTIFEYLFGTSKSKLTAQVYSKLSLELPAEENLTIISEILSTKSDDKISLKRTASIQIIQENVLLYNVDYNSLINELKTAFNENFIDNLKTSQRYIPIKLNYESEKFENIINHLFIKNSNNVYIPIKNLIRVNKIERYKFIEANRNGEFLRYSINSNNNNNNNAVDDDINYIKEKFKKSKDIDVRFSGSWFELKALTTELSLVIITALLLLYFIMAAQFESLWQPIIILLEIPIDIGGALFLLWLFGGTINIMAAIGIVVMCGVIINDSILKIHTINLLRKNGLTVNDAIKKSGKLRLKPILMTSMTTILALTPFIFMDSIGAELQKPLALTIIGGMIIGTFISLYFIPLLYSVLSKDRS